MRWLSPLLFLGTLSGCDALQATAMSLLDRGPSEEASFDLDMLFSTPTYYTVVRGDTLNRIAAKHRVSVAELQRWNGLADHLIEIDQVLLVWDSEPAAPPVAAPGTRRTRVAQRPTTPTTPRASTPAPRAVPTPRSKRPDDWEAPAMASTAGVLGVLGLGSGGLEGTDLGDTLANTRTVHASTVTPSTSLGGRQQLGSTKAEAMTVSIERHFTHHDVGGTRFGSGSVQAPRLAMPGRKSCLSGPTGAGMGELDTVASVGLSESQIRSSLGRFVRHTTACVPAGTNGSFSVMTEITVGCDGRVREAEITYAGGAPTQVVQCIEKTLTYASFPAHDMPGGFVFQYPIRYGG